MKKLKLRELIPTEWQSQRVVFAWAKLHEARYPALKYLHATMNGAQMKSPKQAMTAKLAGMKNGVLDICWPMLRGKGGSERIEPPFCWAGCWIELKRIDQVRAKNGGLSNEQIDWIEWLNSQGWYATVCYGAGDCINVLRWYGGIV